MQGIRTFQDMFRKSFKVFEESGANAAPTALSFASFKLLLLIIGD